MININNLSLSYGEEKLFESVSVSLKKGITYAIMGKSGVGKTTLLRLLAGLEKPQSGSVTGLEHEKKSFIFQENRLLPWLTVEENLFFITADKDKINEALKATALSQHRDKKENELSGGMARRAAIARALAFGGDVFFIDEPLYGLDIKTSDGILEIIRNAVQGKSAFVITHSPEGAFYLADELIFIDNGVTVKKKSDFQSAWQIKEFLI